MSVLAVAALLEQPNHNLLDVMVGMSLNTMAFDLLQEVPLDRLSATTSALLVDALSRIPKALEAGVANAFQMEFNILKNTRELMLPAARQHAEVILKERQIFLTHARNGSYLLRPNKTHKLYADATRENIAQLMRGCHDGNTMNLYVPEVPTSAIPFVTRLWFHENTLGELLYMATYPEFYSVIENVCEMSGRVDLLSAAIASARYRIEQGMYPDSLASLVPHYLQQVPTDQFDRKPIRYNETSGMIYSIGKDRIDNGGKAEEGVDIVFMLQ
jgi:hypothetical protein